MNLRRLPLLIIVISLTLAGLTGCARETPAEHAANVYAAHELAAAPPHGNLPDYALAPADLAKAQHLGTLRVVLHFGGEAWEILCILLLLNFGIFARMRDTAVKISTNRWAQGYMFFLLAVLVDTLLGLPLDLYARHLSLRYGLSVQSWPGWFADQAKTFALTWLIGGLLLVLLFWIIRRLPRTWWFAFWCVSIPIILFGIFVAPYIEPIFFQYQPLAQTNPALVAQLEQVVEKGHMNIPTERMFLMKASAKTTTLNADVEGFGSSKRVVVWDTTIAKMTPDEILFIFGHESGHYVLGHIVSTIIFSLGLLLVTLYVGYLFVHWAIANFGAQWGIPSQNDWAALGVLLLAFSLFGIILEPMENTYSRMHEHAADIYGQEAIHGLVPNPQSTAVTAFDVLGKAYFADPNSNPLYEFWTSTHPSIGRRAAFAKAYNPWLPGTEPKYFKK